MKEYQAKLLLDVGCALGEGPIYDEAKDGLYWLDIEKNRIHYLDFASGRSLYIQMDRPIGSIALTDCGRILAGMDDGVYMVDALQCMPYCLMEEAASECIRFNDGKCDPCGRFIVGTQVTKTDACEEGHLFSVYQKDSYQVFSRGLSCSNGLAWSLDHKTMYHVDTRADCPSQIYAFDYDLHKGSATNRRQVIDFSKEAERGILADGMTVDCHGNLWIAEWGGYGVGCWNPETGEKVAWVDVPVEKVSCCTFGGKNYSTLYITTACGKGRFAGSIFEVDVGVSGFPAVKFKE